MVYLTPESYVMMAGMIYLIRNIQEKPDICNEDCRTECIDASIRMFLWSILFSKITFVTFLINVLPCCISRCVFASLCTSQALMFIYYRQMCCCTTDHIAQRQKCVYLCNYLYFDKYLPYQERNFTQQRELQFMLCTNLLHSDKGQVVGTYLMCPPWLPISKPRK